MALPPFQEFLECLVDKFLWEIVQAGVGLFQLPEVGFRQASIADQIGQNYAEPLVLVGGVNSNACSSCNLTAFGLMTELCLAAVRCDGEALLHVPEAIKTSKLCLTAVRGHGSALKHVPEILKTPDICRVAVQDDGLALEFVPEKLRTPTLCLLAVLNYGEMLQYVPETLKTSELCYSALQQNANALEFVPEALKTPELCLVVAKNAQNF